MAFDSLPNSIRNPYTKVRQQLQAVQLIQERSPSRLLVGKFPSDLGPPSVRATEEADAMLGRGDLQCRLARLDGQIEPEPLLESGEGTPGREPAQERPPELEALSLAGQALVDAARSRRTLQQDHRAPPFRQEAGRGQPAHPRSHDGNVVDLLSHCGPRRTHEPGRQDARRGRRAVRGARRPERFR